MTLRNLENVMPAITLDFYPTHVPDTALQGHTYS